MSSGDDFRDIEQLLRDATHAYVEAVEPAPDSWAQLRGRADRATHGLGPRRWLFGLGGFAVATAAVVALIVALGSGDNTIETDAPPITRPPVTTPEPGAPEIPDDADYVATFSSGDDSLVEGIAVFSFDADTTMWTGTLDAVVDGSDGRRVDLSIDAAATSGEPVRSVCGAVPDADGHVTCSGSFVPTEPLDGRTAFVTEPGTGVATLAHAPIEAVRPSSPASTTTPAPTAPTATLAAGQSVIVSDNEVLGWWEGTKWVRYDAGSIPAVGGEEYQIVRVGEPITTAIGSAPAPGCEFVDPPGSRIDLSDEPSRYGDHIPQPVGVTGVADLVPHDVELLPTSNASYAQAAAELIAAAGGTGEPRLIQVVRTDLEGDGVDEIIVVAETGSPEFGTVSEGETAIAFVRRVADGEVRTDVLDTYVVPAEEYPSPYRILFQVDAIADLNGDGTMEIVLGWSYYEGSGAQVYDFEGGGAPVEVLDGGCGV